MSIEYKKLSDCAEFRKERTAEITYDNYITTDNMLPNKGGITVAASLPDVKTTSKYYKEDILLSNIRPYFCKIWFADKQGSCSNDVLVIKCNKDYCSKFIYYVLSDNNFFNYDTVTSKGTKMPRGTPSAIMKYLVPDFSLGVQEKIVNCLESYDKAIENNNKRIKILEQMAENLYKEWFVRFRFPGHRDVEFTRGIPTDWEYIRLGEIIKIDRGISYTSEEIDCDEGVNLINLKNIQSFGGFRHDGTKKYSGKYKDEQIVAEGDLIMGVTDMTQDRRTVGAVALMPITHDISVISADLIKLSSSVDNVFLYCMFKYGSISRYISQFANGANVLHLRPQVLSNIKVYMPNRMLVERFTNVVKSIVDEINILNEKNDYLIKQREFLLPRLMSGKLEIK